MKERGMIFNGDMVRALLEGRKTQTRRPIKPQPTSNMTLATKRFIDSVHFDVDNGYDVKEIKSPYGIPGDRIWVRETWEYCKSETSNAMGFNLCKAWIRLGIKHLGMGI